MMNLVYVAQWPRVQTLGLDRFYLNFGSAAYQLCNFGYTVYFSVPQITLALKTEITILTHHIELWGLYELTFVNLGTE